VDSIFDDPFGGNGQLLYAYPDKAVWVLALEGEQVVVCVLRDVQPLLEDNQRALNDSAGKRWGDGQQVVNWPIDFYYKHILPARLNDDEAYIKRIINDSEYSKFRRFGGKV
jgi:hypothetical protein